MEEVTKLYEYYLEGIDSQNRLEIREKIPTCVDFYEGKQWPSPTEHTKNLPRPVINVIQMICNQKKSFLLQNPYKIIYKSLYSDFNEDKLNAFADYIQKRLGQRELDRLGIDDGVKKGSYFYHYFWDSEHKELSCEIIDPLNIFFENPRVINEQKQKWILIAKNISVSEAQSLTEENTLKLKLEEEANEEGEVLFLTRYFRLDGQVYFEQGTKTTLLKEPSKIAPCGIGTLYPVVCGVYQRKEKSIYGRSEVEGLIPNQKAMNFHVAMSLLNAQEVAWGKYIALPNALKGQQITNVPGQVLIDYSGTGEGIKRLEEQSLQKTPMELVQNLLELTRSVTGASQVMTGEMIGADLSGTAIAQLQAQASLPLNELKNEFANVKRKQGQVLLQFLKCYYLDESFPRENEQKIKKKETFSSSEIQDGTFEIVLDIVPDQIGTVANDIAILDHLLDKGEISLQEYIDAYPESAMGNKNQFLKISQPNRVKIGEGK